MSVQSNGPKGLHTIKGPTIQCRDMSKSAIHLPGRSQAYTCNVGATEGRGELEGGRPASPSPAGQARASVATMQLLPTLGEDLKRPGEGGVHVSRPAGPTWRLLASRLRVEVKLNCDNCLQPTPRASPVQNRPWKAINRALIPHL